jgi:hypothetical protein
MRPRDIAAPTGTNGQQKVRHPRQSRGLDGQCRLKGGYLTTASWFFEWVRLETSPTIRAFLVTDVAFDLFFITAHRGHEIASCPKAFTRVVLLFTP